MAKPRPDIGGGTNVVRPRRVSHKPTGVFKPGLTAPTRKLTRPAPVLKAEAKLPPPAQLPSYPVKRHYTKREQATIVRGFNKAAKKADPVELLQHPDTARKLLPLTAVRLQQHRARDRAVAKSYGISPTQAAALVRRLGGRQARPGPAPKPGLLSKVLHTLASTRSGQEQAQLGLVKRGYEELLQPMSRGGEPVPHFKLHGLLGLGALSDSLAYQSERNVEDASNSSQALSRLLRSQSKKVERGKGAGTFTPAMFRLPLAQLMNLAADTAPTAGRLGAGAANDAAQFIVGAIPTTAAIIDETRKEGPVAAAKTVAGGMKDILAHPQDHPLFALQLALGGVGAVGRTGGVIGRSGVLGSAAKRAASTERAPLMIGGPAAKNLLEYRHYSKDVIRKGLQVVADKRLKDGENVLYHGKSVTPKVAQDSKIASMLGKDVAGRLRSHGDFVADRANSVERANRAHLQRELARLLPTRAHRGGVVGRIVGEYLDRTLPAQARGKRQGPKAGYRPERDVVGLGISRVIRSAATFEQDLRTELARLKKRAAQKFDHPAERKANLDRQKTIQRVLDDPKAVANAKRTMAAADALATKGREFTDEAVRQGALHPSAANRAPLFDYAITHMGAKYHDEDAHRGLETEARAVEREHAATVRDLGKSAVHVPHDPKLVGKSHTEVSIGGGKTGSPVRGKVVDPKGEQVPDTLYHVTTNLEAVERKGVLEGRGEGGLGGDSRDRIVSMTTKKEVAHQIEADLKFVARLRREVGPTPKLPEGGERFVYDAAKKEAVPSPAMQKRLDFTAKLRAALEAEAKREGWEYTGKGRPDYNLGDYLNHWFWERNSKAGTENPIIFDLERVSGLLDESKIGTVSIPKKNVQTGAMVTSLPHLDELRIHGDVRLREPAAEEVAAAKAAHQAARDHRIAVSGRNPQKVRAHEAARAAHMRASKAVKAAEDALEKAQRARSRLVGSQQTRRGKRQAEALGTDLTKVSGKRAPGQATKAEKAKLEAANERVKGAKLALRDAVAARRTTRLELQKNKLPKPKAGLRKGDGTLLTNREIEQHMVEQGQVPVGADGKPLVSYLPHRPDELSHGSYHRAQALLRRDSLEGYKRTGAAFEKGITGSSFNLVADHLVRMGITTGRGAIGQFDQLVHDAGVKRHDGTLFTPKEAKQEAANLSEIPGQPKLVPVIAFRGKTSKGQQAIIKAAQDPLALDAQAFGVHKDLGHFIEQAFLDRTDLSKLTDKSARNVVLMPEALVNHFQMHLRATANRSPTGALLARGFRTAVLPFSTKWLVGNVAEAALRLAIIGANPLDVIAGHKVVKALEGRHPKTAVGRRMFAEMIGLDAERAGTSTEVQAALLGGLFYGEKGLTIHRDTSHYEATKLRVPAEAIGGLGKTPVLAEGGHMLAAIPKSIFALNRALEQTAQKAALGRFTRRDIQEFTGSWMKSALLHDQAIQEAARGYFNTPHQRDAAKFIDATLGKYSRFGPRLRAMIQTVTPFLPWYLNAVRFIFWTLPVGHPVKTAVLQSAEVAFHDDVEAQHKTAFPGSLKAAVPTKDGGFRDLARFTPFGVGTELAGGGDLSDLVGLFFPQFQGAAHAAFKQDPFGRALKLPKTKDNPEGKAGTGDMLKALANALLGSSFPGYSPVQRIAEHGETAYGNSSLLFGIHTKPGTSHGSSGVERVLDPFRPVYLGGAKETDDGLSTAERNRILQRARAVKRTGPTDAQTRRLLQRARQAAAAAG